MDFFIEKSSLEGELVIPASKSQTMRAILFAALGEGTSTIHHVLDSPDTQAMMVACRSLGARMSSTASTINIEGLNGHIEEGEDVIQAGNSGIVLRFISAVSGLARKPIVITGDYSIRHQRPMRPLIEALSQLGVSAQSTRSNGFAPLIIQGPYKGGRALFSGEDSQHVSALLIASIFSKYPTVLEVRNPGEKPWVALTLSWLDRLGISYENEEFKRYYIQGNCSYKAFTYDVPGDLSTLAFPVAAALMTRSDLAIRNVDLNDPQGDKQLIEILRKMGAVIDWEEKEKTLYVRKTDTLEGIEVDINSCIDALPIIAVLGTFAKGKTCITNAAIARTKECDRLHSIAQELRKMGANIVEEHEGLTIQSSPLRGASVASHQDHRLAMALAVAGMSASGKTYVQGVECIAKTYSTFYRDFKGLGACIENKE